MSDALCPMHSGFDAKIDSLEENVSKLWSKWDGMQKLVIGTMVSTTLSLLGIIVILFKSLM